MIFFFPTQEEYLEQLHLNQVNVTYIKSAFVPYFLSSYSPFSSFAKVISAKCSLNALTLCKLIAALNSFESSK